MVYNYIIVIFSVEGVIMQNTMCALVKDKPEEGLTMKRVEIPEVGHGEVKIKIHKTAICGILHISGGSEG